jgi:hypothetical protein
LRAAVQAAVVSTMRVGPAVGLPEPVPPLIRNASLV